MSLLKQILYAGLNEEMPNYLKRKVFPTNLVGLLLLFGIAIPFTIISLIYFPELAWYPAVGGLACAGVLFSNLNGGILYSRVVLSVIPITLGAIYNAYLSKSGEQPLPSLYLIELGFAMIPFVIFDLSEKGFLVLIVSLCAILILTFPITNDWFDSASDSKVLRSGWLSSLTIGLAILSAVGCILGLALLNKEAEQASETLINTMNEKNKKLELSEVELKENLKKVEQAQADEKKRNWATEGIALISEILRSNQENSQAIYDNLTSNLVRYLSANQAGFYILHRENEQETIKLVSCYAYQRKKFLEQELSVSESGLLGQAYLEGEYIYLTDVPEGYVKITSGLGEATPKSLIIVPLKVNGIVEGIFELASFNELQTFEIDFLLKVGEGIASFIQSNRVNERTSELLRQTMNQAEEMRAQEEELRQNLEEMEVIQEEISRKENAYIRQIEALKKELSVLKEA